jgi:F0F1-type ATP synthase membrane subunit c/vacuolar-type H+-ATPase subunit K
VALAVHRRDRREAGAVRPALILVGLAEGIAIYGLIVSVLILNKL